MRKYLSLKNIIIAIILVVLIIISFLINNKIEPKTSMESINENNYQVKSNNSENNKTFYVDIKGSIKKPGVYKFNENEMIIDAITKAGGLTKYATTTNINLSKKLIPEMVIYIFTKNELKKKEPETIIINNVPECKCEVIEVNNCVNEPIIDNSSTIDQTSSTTDSTSSSEVISKLININTSNLMELQQLPGIGESKANLIIQYRNTIGLFTKIEDIKNVSGIGDATYKNIKDLIKV